ncbi:thiopeptide maturation pyridine synthase [Streptomyces huiliensis]|uniref:thiopeptide maturation pyridine synthase n=1 Tax=Streptomyces huiliensis TaxID=2876027 RepID=UPI001CBACF77|nr:thiopeptide maturation pyridine synthase [Streptomyces huiliensis]MBZ4323637.1 hypothetical protein [Streptomyces huiliensis]
MSRPAPRWHSLHVHHHDAAAEPALVLDGVRPAFEAVRGWTRGAWFGRHWLRGPHLRLNFRAPDPLWEARVRPVVTDAIEAYLRVRPSAARLDEAALGPVHERLAELEMETGPRHPWVPDNTVLERPYDHRLPVLGSPRASELLAGFLSDTNDLAFRMYEHRAAGGSTAALALDLMWTTASVAAVPFEAGGPPIVRGFLSLRSHADAFLSRTRDPAAQRAAFDARYDRQAAALGARLRAVREALDGRRDDVPFVADWAGAIRRRQRIAYPLLASGAVSMRGAGLAPRPPARQVSGFHRLLQSGHGQEDFLWTDPWFASFRLMINYLYVHLNRLGLGPADRALLCHLAASTVETVHGVTAADLFRRHVLPPSRDRAPEWRRLAAEWDHRPGDAAVERQG